MWSLVVNILWTICGISCVNTESDMWNRLFPAASDNYKIMYIINQWYEGYKRKELSFFRKYLKIHILEKRWTSTLKEQSGLFGLSTSILRWLVESEKKRFYDLCKEMRRIFLYHHWAGIEGSGIRIEIIKNESARNNLNWYSCHVVWQMIERFVKNNLLEISWHKRQL